MTTTDTTEVVADKGGCQCGCGPTMTTDASTEATRQPDAPSASGCNCGSGDSSGCGPDCACGTGS